MSFNSVDWRYWLVGLGFSLLAFLTGSHLVWPVSNCLNVAGVAGGVFCFDYVSLYLVLLSGVLWISLVFWFSSLSGLCVLFLGLSILSSIACYCCVHAFWFWVFYEMSIIFLLVLLIVDSPYSERYIASWYLLGYVVLTSLPMLLCLLYLVELYGGVDMRLWNSYGCLDLSSVCVSLLAVMFITKIPLFPFHVWLPIVHAEASSPVSVCLSGYIMKLGVLGVFRFCSSVLSQVIFSNSFIWVCLGSAIFFYLSASRELDGKRWLAFLSLSHIVVVAVCLGIGSWQLVSVSFLYCLGHGLSAGLIFLFMWLVYEAVSTRNLVLVKGGLSKGLVFRVAACLGLCTACSLPPTVQFFSEVFLVLESGGLSLVFVFLLYLFLFCGGLVPLFLVGSMLTRHYDIDSGWGSLWLGLFSVFLLILWSFVFFMVS